MQLNGWTAPRLDDAFREVREDISECKRGINEINAQLAARTEQRIVERDRRDQDRKADRRWFVGSIFTAAGLVIATVGLLADKL